MWYPVSWKIKRNQKTDFQVEKHYFLGLGEYILNYILDLIFHYTFPVKSLCIPQGVDMMLKNAFAVVAKQ